jgi:hypothetical protein
VIVGRPTDITPCTLIPFPLLTFALIAALVGFSSHNAFAQHKVDPEKRAAGLFVLARLGEKAVLEPVSRMLASGPPANSRDTLMSALAEITTPEEFQRRVPSSLAWSSGYKEALLYARYLAEGPQEKIPLCLQMLRSPTPGHRELAVRCLLENGHANDLRPPAALDLEAPGRAALIRNEIRKAGWRIIDKDDEFVIEPADSVRHLP